MSKGTLILSQEPSNVWQAKYNNIQFEYLILIEFYIFIFG